jgi:apolipoprotein N-acyltransferase
MKDKCNNCGMLSFFLFGASIISIIFIFSYSEFSPFLFIAFTFAFELINNFGLFKQITIIASMLFIVTLIVFLNPFFINRYDLILVAALYFTFLLGCDIIIIKYLLNLKYGISMIFLYIPSTRIILMYNTLFFPFYWTLTIQLLPIMNVVSKYIIPILFEVIFIVLCVNIYFSIKKKYNKIYLFQTLILLLLSIFITNCYNRYLKPKQNNNKINCTFIQGGYSSADYTVIENYPILANKIADNYLSLLYDIDKENIIILPESSIPINVNYSDEIITSIGNIAYIKKAYIIVNLRLNDKNNNYNSVVVFNPVGNIQDIYIKRNLVPFLEDVVYTKGNDLNNFNIDNNIFAPMICFDSVYFINYIRSYLPNYYIVLSNDVFAEGTILSKFHQAYAVINSRTIGIPLLQIIQNGPSFYINSKGKLFNLTKPYENVFRSEVLLE